MDYTVYIINDPDIKIFMDIMEKLNALWKIKRDIKKRGLYSIKSIRKY